MDIIDVGKIKVLPSQQEIPVHNNQFPTKRAYCDNIPQNSTVVDKLEAIKIITELDQDLETKPIEQCPIQNYIEDLQAVFNPLNVTECNTNLFDDNKYTVIQTTEELKKLLSEILIRFDTNPKNYQKNDFDRLIILLYRSLLFLYENHPLGVITDKWLDPHSDKRVPSEKLVKETIDAESERMEGLISNETSARQSADSDLQDNIDSEAGTRATEITRVEGLISAEELARQQADTNLQNTKQDNLTAGDNIQINGTTISATDTVYDDTEVRGLIDAVDQKVDNLDEFTCGTIVSTTTNFVEGTDYTIHEALQRTANLFEGYQGEIDDINELIPNQTTPQNQLADKAFVNNTVATNAANFRGNWSTWAAVPTNVSDYPEDYTGSKTPTNNDYLVIQDGTDYDPSNTGMWRFIYVGDWSIAGKSGWTPQYRVGSAFTAEQQAAIDSGITSTKVTKYEGYNSSIGALQTDKLDKVYTANKIYGTNNLGTQTAYTAGNGISFNNGQINSTAFDDLFPLIAAGL